MSLALWLGVALLFSAYFSGMETAYTSFDRVLSLGWIKSKQPGARVVRFFSSHPERFLSTTLIGNKVADVAYASLLVVLAEQTGLSAFWLVTVSPLIVLIFAELLPKTFGYGFANRVVRYLSHPLFVSHVIVAPMRWLLVPFTKLVARTKAERHAADSAGDSYEFRRELDHVLVGSQEEGALTVEEAVILARYFDVRDMKVRQIMTPRTEMTVVSEDTPPDEIREVFVRSRYNILPVYEGTVDRVIGYLRAQDFIAPRDFVKDVLRPVPAVPESKLVVDLMQEFRTEHLRAVIVIDEYGGTDGIVTVKDIFQALVGPVAERWDPNEPVIKRIAPGRFLVSGLALTDDIEKATGVDFPVGEYTTLSGFLADHLGRIPDLWEQIEISGITIRIIRRSPRRVEGCLVKVATEAEESEAGLDKR